MTTTEARGGSLRTSNIDRHTPLPPILRLPSSLGSLLRSTAQLPSLSSLVTQLAHNAIDAGAAQVRVSIHPDSCAISCWDNGEGFHAGLLAPSTAADADAALDRYVTTKARSSMTYGKRGEALASMAAIGLLHIETTLHGGSDSRLTGTRWTILKRGDRLLYSGPTDEIASMPSFSSQSQLLPATSTTRKGTIVTIRDIFSSLPLRRPLLSSRDSLAREVKACSQALAHVSLREQRVSFLLEVASASAGRTSVHLRGPACESMLDRFAQLRYAVPPEACGTVYAKRRLVPRGGRSSSEQDQVTTAAAPRLVVKGFFLFEGQESKADQHVYLQGHRLPAGVELSDFWAQIGGDQRYEPQGLAGKSRAPSSGVHWQRRSAISSAAKAAAAMEDDPTIHAALAHTIARGFKSSDLDSSANLAGAGGPKRYERRLGAATLRGSHPAYVFDVWLHLPAAQEVKGGAVVLDEEAVVAALCEEVRDVQRVHGLVRKAKKRPATTGATTTMTTTTGQDDGAKEQAAKRPKTTAGAHDALRLPTVFPSVKHAKPRAAPPDDGQFDKQLDSGAQEPAGATGSSFTIPPGFVSYADPVTKRSYLVDSRTGNSYPADSPLPGTAVAEQTSTSEQASSAVRPSKPSVSRFLGANRQTLRRDWDAVPQAAPPRWLEETLNEWTNPALPLQRTATDNEGEVPIHALPSLFPLLNGGDSSGGNAGGTPESCPCCAGNAAKQPTASQQQYQTRQERTLPLPHVQLKSSYFTSRPSNDTARHGPSCSSFTHQQRQLLSPHDAHSFPVKKEHLTHARVIGQAAKKFIVCLVSLSNTRRGIICVDQHAADERVRLEAMFAEYVEGCRRGEEGRRTRGGEGERDGQEEAEEGPSHCLKAPLCIWLPEVEAREVLQGLPLTTTEDSDKAESKEEELSATGRRLRYWGFGFARPSEGQATASASAASAQGQLPVIVTHVPRAVSERLRREVATLTAVVRSFVLLPTSSTAHDTTADTPAADMPASLSSSFSPSSWMSALRHLPKRLVDLFKSRACRGAIMFNDSLTQEQCERLGERWKGTDLPLICAHGRRSVVGLCGLTVGGDISGEGVASEKRGRVKWERAQLLGKTARADDDGEV